MLNPEEINEVRRLFFAEHWKVGTVAAQLKIHPDAVRRAIKADSFKRSSRDVKKIAGPYLEFIEKTLIEYPRLRVTRIYEMIEPRGYKGSISQLRRIVKEIRSLVNKEAFFKLITLPGEQAQVDWGSFGEIQVGNARRKLSAFVMVLSWSRAMHVLFTLDQQQGNFLRGHVESFEYFGGVPRVLLYDNLKSAVLQRVGHSIHFHPRLLELSSYYHYEPRPVAVARGNEKGRVERAIRFLRDRFFAARHFRDVDDLNAQFCKWRDEWAHQRPCPEDRSITVAQAFEKEKSKLMPLPIHGFKCETVDVKRSGKQPYIKFDLNNYSIPFELLRKPLTLAASHDTVRILDKEKEVATHPRSYERDKYIEIKEHLSALAEHKRSARQSREMTSLFRQVEGAKQLLENVVARGESLVTATRQLERLLEDYGADELTFAVAVMLERNVTAPSAAAQILEQERSIKKMKPPVNTPISNDPRVQNLTVGVPNLGGYDDLSE